MAGGKKSQNEDEVLGQIFDFIFKEARKRPDKRKPVKSTGISTSGALADGIAAALEKPGLFVTDQSLQVLNDALTVEFARINADETGDSKAKFTTTNLIDFIKDPDTFLSKPKNASRKAIRDYMKAGFLGRVHQELQANAWAQRYNLDLDAKKAIRGHFIAEEIREKEAGRALGTYAGMQISTKDLDSRKNLVISRSCDLVGMEMFGRSGWEEMSEERKIDFQKAVIRGDGAVEEYLKRTYTGSNAKWTEKALDRYYSLVNDGELKIHKKKEKGGNWFGEDGIKFSDVGTYQKLEMRNIQGRMEDLQNYLRDHPNLPQVEKQRIEEGIQQLGQTSVLLSGNLSGASDKKKFFEAKSELKNRIISFQKELSQARASGDKEKEKAIKYKIGELRKGDRELNNMRFWSTIGEIDGKWNSMRAIWGPNGENIISSVLDGSFYDDTRNSFLLTSNRDNGVSFGKYSWEIKDENGKPKDCEYKSQVRILTSVGGRGLRGAYNSLMTNIYYLTPKSIMNTFLVNGEGFLFLAYKEAQEAGMSIDFGKLAKGDKGYLAELATKKLSKGQIKRLTTLSKLGNFFSFGQRQRDKIKNWMDDHVFRKLRQRLYNSLINKIKDKGALALMEKWLAKGGFEVLAKALVTNVLTALGIGVSGGLGSFIAPILSALVTDILYDTAKFLIQFVMIISIGIVGLMIFLSSSSQKRFGSQTYAYTYYVPGEVEYNPNFVGISPIIGEDDDHNIGDFVAGSLPDGEKCLLGAGSFNCTQGPYGSYSHSNVAAVDITGTDSFYAPAFCGNDNCVVTYSGSAHCTNGYAGGMVKFKATYGGSTYEFTLIHVSTTYGVGTKLSAGQKVARVMTIQETTHACSSGEHLHLQTKLNGSVVDPQDVLKNSTSSGGFGCNLGACPAK